MRLKEAQKLGFSRAVAPASALETEAGRLAGVRGIDQLADLVASIGAGAAAEWRNEAAE